MTPPPPRPTLLVSAPPSPPPPHPQDPNYKDSGVSHQTAQLNRYLPKPKNKNGHYLVDSKKSAADAAVEKERKELDEKEAAVALAGADREAGRFFTGPYARAGRICPNVYTHPTKFTVIVMCDNDARQWPLISCCTA